MAEATVAVPVARGARSGRLSWLPWRALGRDKMALAAFAFIVFIIVMAIVWPMVSPFDVQGRDLPHALLPPMSTVNGHLALFGTDALGRDVLVRIFYGARVSLSLAVAVAVISGTVGVTLGVIAGFYRGWIDNVIMRVVDVFMAIPSIFFVLLVLYVVGTSTVNLILVMSIARWMLYCRVARGLTLSLREQTFIRSAIALGASDRRVMLRHLVPNLMSSVLTIGTIDIARVILLESSISFLGLGLQAPAVSWGLLVAGGKDYIFNAWWLIAFPGVFIFLTCLSINLFGLWLRMVNDPVHRWRYLSTRKRTG